MSGARVIVVGDVIDDVIVVPQTAIRPDTDTRASITRHPGGSAGNTAAWLGSLGASVDFVGCVGRGDAERHGDVLLHGGRRGGRPYMWASVGHQHITIEANLWLHIKD